MTKADRIRNLIKQGRSNRAIADIVGCLTAYVRTIRQRDSGINYGARNYATNKQNPDRVAAANERARLAYKIARAEGLPWQDAHAAYTSTRNKHLRRSVAA